MNQATLFLIAGMILAGCSLTSMNNIPAEHTPHAKQKLTYLALGDSYTIGESVQAQRSFPYQLAAALKQQGIILTEPQIVARTGWTTDELISAIHADNIKEHYDLVTLLIGVNNQYRGYDINIYKAEFRQLLKKAITFAKGNKDRVYVLSIPDWGVTPYAAGRDAHIIATEIDAYNAIASEACLKEGVKFQDITSISRKALQDPELTAKDGLHPSDKMYGLWVEQIIGAIRKPLNDR